MGLASVLLVPQVQAQPTLVAETFSEPVPEVQRPVTFSTGGSSHLCFKATSSLVGDQLFCYDGSTLRQVTDLGGLGLDNESRYVTYDGALYFVASWSEGDGAVWSYDGSTVSRVSQGFGYSGAPSGLTVYDGVLYFVAAGSDGNELWSYDGSTVSQAADINSGSGDGFVPYFDHENIAVYDGTLYFGADGGTDGNELWSYDGSTANQVQDINSGSTGSFPADLTTYNGKLYIEADGGTDGYELWSYDGSTVSQAADINSGSGDAFPDGLTVYNGLLYFEADGGSAGAGVWSYDGTTPTFVDDIAALGFFAVHDGTLYLTASEGADGQELWSYNGSSFNQVADVTPGSDGSSPTAFTPYDGSLYFLANVVSTNDVEGGELWRFDGTDVTRPSFANNVGTAPGEKGVYNGTLYFGAKGDLWRSDGSTVSRVADIGSSTEQSPADFEVYDGTLYFRANGGSDGPELWEYDGSGASQVDDINPGSDGASPAGLTVYDGALYFAADGGTDGTELWSFDGSSVTQVDDIYSGSASSLPSSPSFGVYDGILYFGANGGSDGIELWSYNGSATSQVADINSNNSSFFPHSLPQSFQVYDGTLYFAAYGDSDGTELWSYNGTSSGQAADINSGSSSSNPSALTVYDGTLYFGADGGTDGRELWSYDGSTPSQAADINSGAVGSDVEDLAVFNNLLYFTAENRQDGREPHSYDGSGVSSIDFASGSITGGGVDPVVYDDGSGSGLYVTATDDQRGLELYVFDQHSAPLPVEFTAFNARAGSEAIHLNWTTASETNNAGFRVQRQVAGHADRGNEWTVVGSVEGAGTTQDPQSYRFTDRELPSDADLLTYRLKQRDKDGTAHYSTEVTVERDVREVKLLNTAPNPATQQVVVRYALPNEQNVEVNLYDVLGRRVRTVVDGKQKGRHTRSLDVSNLSTGVYFVRLRADDGVHTQKVTVTR